MYALYSKNKPKSDSLLASHGNAFFRVSGTDSSLPRTAPPMGAGGLPELWGPLPAETALLGRQFKQIQLGDKMNLASYLLKPIQRMSKYALLLKDLIKTCGEAQEQELAYLRAAEQMVRFQLRHGNDLLAMDAIRDCDVRIGQEGWKRMCAQGCCRRQLLLPGFCFHKPRARPFPRLGQGAVGSSRPLKAIPRRHVELDLARTSGEGRKGAGGILGALLRGHLPSSENN